MHSPRLRSMSSHAPHDGRVAGASPVDWIRSKRSLLAVVIGACIVLLVLVVSISQVSVWGLLPLMGTIKLPGALRRNRFEGPFWRNNQTLAVRPVLDHERLRIESHDIKLNDGTVVRDWLWVDETPSVSMVVHVASPPDPARPFLILIQERYALNYNNDAGRSHAVVGGYVDNGEPPGMAARRELLEEMRMESDNWVDLGGYRVNANRGMSMCYSYLAMGARRSSKVLESDDLTPGTSMYVSFGELQTLSRQHAFLEVKWASTVAMAILHLHSIGYGGP